MTDCETLEFAAKAAGIDDAKLYHPVNFWSPLSDDGDAFRLAVKLNFRVECTEDGQAYVWLGNRLLWNEFAIHENLEHERISAVRRVIVRAAAAIGKAVL